MENEGTYGETFFGGSASPFFFKSKKWKGQKLHRKIKIHWELAIFNVHFSEKSKSFHFCDFGPNGSYRESLKALCVLPRMPAGLISPQKHLAAVIMRVLGLQKNSKAYEQLPAT